MRQPSHVLMVTEDVLVANRRHGTCNHNNDSTALLLPSREFNLQDDTCILARVQDFARAWEKTSRWIWTYTLIITMNDTDRHLNTHRNGRQVTYPIETLQWRHNERDGISNHRRLDCLPNSLFWRRPKKKIKAPCYWPLWGEFTGDRWIPRTKGQ